MTIEKVCVRIPVARKDELLAIAKRWRDAERGPGWDAKVIHQIAREHFGGLLEMFERHDWPERGSDMMRFVQSHVKATYGSVDAFAAKFGHDKPE
jgi:hypothetical protein